MTTQILVAGIGNIFMGDDAFGCEVAWRLAKFTWPEGVSVVDFGIRGFDLCCALLKGYDAVVLVDAFPHGEPPGSLSVVEIDMDALDDGVGTLPDGHTLDPV